MVAGIYLIRCLDNTSVYVGQARNIKRRWARHRSSLNRNCHHNIKLQHAWNKYGESHFDFEVLQELQNVGDSEMNEAETNWMNHYISMGFNLMNIAPTGWTNTGRSVSEETRKKISDKLMGHPVSPETRSKLVALSTGRPLPESAKTKLTGRHLSDVTKERMSLSRKGRVMSEAAKQSMRGRKRSQEHTQKITLAVSKHWLFLSPDGELLHVVNLVAFCRTRNLNNRHMAEVFYGQLKQHKGWKRPSDIDIANWQESIGD